MITEHQSPIINAAEYNASHEKRGKLIEYIIEGEAKRRAESTGEPGRPRVYVDRPIWVILMLKDTHHRSLRAAAEFMEAAVRLKWLDSKIPIPPRSAVVKRPSKLKCLPSKGMNH